MPTNQLDEAAKLLQTMQIESPRLLESPDSARRTAELVEEVQRKKDERLERLLLRDDDQFRRLAKRGRLAQSRALARTIANAGSMLGHH